MVGQNSHLRSILDSQLSCDYNFAQHLGMDAAVIGIRAHLCEFELESRSRGERLRVEIDRGVRARHGVIYRVMVYPGYGLTHLCVVGCW